MGEIVLVRHGQASFGAADYDKLSPLGHEQATWLGHYFEVHGMRFDRALRGSLRRHRETADGIASAMGGFAVEEDARLNELNYGDLQEQFTAATGTDGPVDRPTFLSVFPEVFVAWEEGRVGGSGESYDAFQARVDAAVDAALVPGGRTLIVTSGGVIGATLRRVLGLSARAAADLLLNIHNASVHRLEHEGGQLRLSLFNASPHLDPVERAHARTYV
ncbi:MAG: histidine phosphatase family protein [Pseudomonadota bacterium]